MPPRIAASHDQRPPRGRGGGRGGRGRGAPAPRGGMRDDGRDGRPSIAGECHTMKTTCNITSLCVDGT